MFRVMQAPSKPRPSHIFGSRSPPKAFGASHFLRTDSVMSSLLPTAMKMASLQKDCAAALPPMFHQCDILQYQDGQLVLATPNSAVAAKLKQQLPKLQASLRQSGWQVEAIRLKVAVTKSIAPVVHTRQLLLPPTAVSAFAELGETLEPTPANAGLIAALRAMAARRR